MAAQLTIPVSDRVFAYLQARAAEAQTTPEAVAAEQLDRVLPPTSLFLSKWAGSIGSGMIDGGTRHDDYIGQTLHEELSSERSG